jgi:alpha-L-rhamnosidase
MVNPTLLSHAWSAAWIAHPSVSVHEYGVFHFRRSFHLDARPGSFVVNVSADNRYRLFINGHAVSEGPARGDLWHWRFETVDLASLLKPGGNVLAAEVWNYADDRPWAQVSHHTGFLLQGNDPVTEQVNTGAQWKVFLDAAYSLIPVSEMSVRDFVAVGPGDRIDGARYPWGWQEEGFDDSDWPSARIVGRAAPRGFHDANTYWMLTPRTIPPMESTPLPPGRIARCQGIEASDELVNESRPLAIAAATTASILLDQAFLAIGYPELTVSGGAGSTIRLTYAEALVDANNEKGPRDSVEGRIIKGHQDLFIADGGSDRTYRPLWVRTWRYLQLDIATAAQPLTVVRIRGVFTAYPFQENALFASSDASLDAIWRVGWRTARLCAGETYFDCPYYEQLQYAGDTRIQALISMYVAGDDRLARNAIRLFDDSRTPDGLTSSRYPTSMPQVIPPFSLFWISMIHDHWMHVDDPAFTRSFEMGIRGVLDWYKRRIDASGMLGPMEWWNFVDWPDQWPWSVPAAIGGIPDGAENGGSSILTLHLAATLAQAAGLMEAFQETATAETYRAMAESLNRAVRRLCWDERRGYVADTPEKKSFSQHANVMAVLAGLVPSEELAAFMRRVVGDQDLIQCTLYFRFYLVRALKKAGLADGYVAQLGPWRDMLAMGLTTFAERPEPTRSDCHAWSASPNYDFLATICGIEPAEPGFKSVRIAPALGPLTWAKGSLPHPRGRLQASFQRNGAAGIIAQLSLPGGLAGTFHWNGRSAVLRPGHQEIMIP